jgi:hypothetical protein
MITIIATLRRDNQSNTSLVVLQLLWYYYYYNTSWFKYDQDWFVCKQAAQVPVIFELPCIIIIIIIIIINNNINNITKSSFQYSPPYLPGTSPYKTYTQADQLGQWRWASLLQISVSLCRHQVDSSLGSDDPTNTLRIKSRRSFAVRRFRHF